MSFHFGVALSCPSPSLVCHRGMCVAAPVCVACKVANSGSAGNAFHCTRKKADRLHACGASLATRLGLGRSAPGLSKHCSQTFVLRQLGYQCCMHSREQAKALLLKCTCVGGTVGVEHVGTLFHCSPIWFPFPMNLNHNAAQIPYAHALFSVTAFVEMMNGWPLVSLWQNVQGFMWVSVEPSPGFGSFRQLPMRLHSVNVQRSCVFNSASIQGWLASRASVLLHSYCKLDINVTGVF